MVHLMPTTTIIPIKRIENAIYVLRGQKIMLDEDLAELYEIPVMRLNEQVRRNSERFPKDFMFKISQREHDSLQSLRSQFAILKKKRGRHRKYLPLAFTEHGILMLSSVLRSKRAIHTASRYKHHLNCWKNKIDTGVAISLRRYIEYIPSHILNTSIAKPYQVNIEIMRAFVEMRKMILSYSDLCRRVDLLESRYDEQFRIVFDTIKKLMTPDPPPGNTRPLAFRLRDDDE